MEICKKKRVVTERVVEGRIQEQERAKTIDGTSFYPLPPF